MKELSFAVRVGEELRTAREGLTEVRRDRRGRLVKLTEVEGEEYDDCLEFSREIGASRVAEEMAAIFASQGTQSKGRRISDRKMAGDGPAGPKFR